MSGLFNRGTNSNAEPALGSLKVQTSVFGTVVPVVYGRTKIAGNLLWYNGFKSIPVTTEQSGKGGSNSYVSGYNYQADVLMALGEGPITNVAKVWVGKAQISGGAATTVQNIQETLVVDSAGDVTTGALISAFGEVYSVQLVGTSDQGEMTAPWSFPSGGGFSQKLHLDPSLAGRSVIVSYGLKITAYTSALTAAGLALRTGGINQAVIPQISSSYPAEALAYAGIAYVFGASYGLGQSGSVENHQFEVDGALMGSGVGVDADPALIVKDILSSPRNGVQFELALVSGLDVMSDYCVANGLTMSPAFTSQTTARQAIQDILDATNVVACWGGDQLRFIPRGDKAISANGRTFTPNNTVAFDIGPDDFELQGIEGVRVRRSPLAERFNRITAEFSNRANQYATEPVTWEDDAARDRDGVITGDTKRWAMFCDGQAALQAATLLGQRAQAQVARYEFTLGWRFLPLQLGDLVRITDPLSGLAGVIARVTELSEDSNDALRVTAVDFPIGNASAAVVPPQLGSGFNPNTNADPGNCTAPLFLEPPGGLTPTGLEVWIATSGTSQLWGGAEVYTSLDGTNWKHAGAIEVGARYGSLTGALGAGGSSVPVSLLGRGGQLVGVPAAAADTQQSLCWIGSGAGGEFASFETAALTGANAYTLGSLHRAQNGTSALAHSSGEGFVFVDSGLGKSGPLDRSLVGKTLYFKLAAFNVFGGGRQSLASVPTYSYTITGRFVDQLGQPVTQANIGVGVAGNLVPNSDWRSAETGWANGTGTVPDPITQRVEIGSNALANPPRNYLLFQNGTNAGQVQAVVSGAFSVAPGQRYGYAASVLAQRCSAQVILRWLDSSGATISEDSTAVVAAGTNAADLSHYTRAGGFAAAPGTAAQAVLILKKLGTSSGATSAAWYAMPTVAIAGPAQTDLPVWDAGAAAGALASFHQATTDLLAINAASETSTISDASTTTVTTGTITPAEAYQQVLELTVTNPTSGAITVNVEASGRMVGTSNASGSSTYPTGFVGMQIISKTEWDSLGASWPTEPGAGQTVGGGNVFDLSLLVKRSMVLAAGATEKYRLYIVADYCKTAALSKKNLTVKLEKR
jgi:hypothetical protein